jgi:hypothetical protein
VLDRNVDIASTVVAPPYPSTRLLEIKQPSAELSIREFLSLRECKLHTVIAHRNSQLGKVSSVSQRLFSDLAMLHLGPQCVAQLGEIELATKLSLFLKQKETNLDTLLWYALLGQSENASFWHDKQNNKQYPLELSIDVSADIIGLKKFASRVIHGERLFSPEETSQVERYLGHLRAGDGGRLLGEYQHLINGLEKANSVIQQRLDSPLCLSATPTQNARYFANVINTRFIEHVQKHSVRLDQRAEKLLSAYYYLEKPLMAYAAIDYQRWAQKRDAFIQEGQAATLQHVRLVQQLYKQCGLLAGA